MRAPTISNPGRELARRVSGGIKITLYWNADDNTTSIESNQRPRRH
jgi:YD repeat-containing protein